MHNKTFINESILSIEQDNKNILQTIDILHQRLNKISSYSNETEVSPRKLKLLIKENNILKEEVELLRKCLEVQTPLKRYNDAESLLNALTKDIPLKNSSRQKIYSDILNNCSLQSTNTIAISDADKLTYYMSLSERELDHEFELLELPPKLRADLLTKIAFYIKQHDMSNALNYLLKAWFWDNNYERLKLLSLNYWEAGEVVRACACARLLPDDLVMTEEERDLIKLIIKSGKI